MEQNAQIKAIDLKGIVRNASKLAQQDGEMDELINLRLKDGSWQPTGDGKIVFEMPDGHFFSQMYVHTNIYRHVLGVENGALYWFANIDKDSNFYTGADGEADNEYHADAYSLFWQNGVYTPIKICDVSGKVTIAQTGHLLTVIDEADAFEYYLYKNDEYVGTQEYKKIEVEQSYSQTNRDFYPFGQIHFNYHAPTPDVLYQEKNISIQRGANTAFFSDDELNTDNHKYISIKKNGGSIDERRANISACFADLENRNVFTRPLLVCAAIKLYDGTFLYTSNPVLIYPRQAVADRQLYYKSDYTLDDIKNTQYYTDNHPGVIKYLKYDVREYPDSYYAIFCPSMPQVSVDAQKSLYLPTLPIYGSEKRNIFPTLLQILQNIDNHNYTAVLGYDLVCHIRDIDVIRQNSDIFKSVCIFVTPEVQNYDYTDSSINNTGDLYSKLRDNEKITYDLLHNSFFLLREYETEELTNLQQNQIIDISAEKYQGLLHNINNGIGTKLTYESVNTYQYIPKSIFYYNNRLHIANYQRSLLTHMHIDAFQRHNLPLVSKNTARSQYIGLLDDFEMSGDIKIYPHTNYRITRYTYQNKPSVYIKTKVKTDKGMAIYVQYIDETNYRVYPADNILSLNPLYIFPDKRAFETEIYCIVNDDYITKIYKKTLQLKEHPLYNIAYYLEPNLKPIDFDFIKNISSDSDYEDLPQQKLTGDTFPNGLKVSAVDNPLYFPVESTYQVGSSEIVALMSNTKAVGTGQTGEAPLYVFTKDGVYGLFVDSSGEVAYSTARILTRDVCNNADSVTPIDDGVVFTTDRGLMLMAGEEAKELSQPAEGEPNHFTKVSDNVEYCKIAANALELGALANMANQYTKEDLLEFLKGCIINYNHNERELMVSNPSKNYTYILDREGNWSKRDYTASEYVNNFPTSYRVQNLKFYKVDEESNADNGVYLLTRPIKLDTLAYKQAFRCVVRGVFELMNGEQYAAEQRIATVEPKLILTQLPSRLQSQKDDGGSVLYDFKVNKEIVLQRYTIKEGGYTTVTFMEDEAYLYVVGNGCVVRMSGHIELSVWKKTEFNGHDIWVNVGEVVGRDIAVDDNHITMPLTDLDNSGESYININKAQAGEYELRLKVVMDYDSTAYSMQDVLMTENNGFAVTIDHAGKIPLRLGLYVFGSYDGRKWAMIGGKEKTGGMFTDIGCKVERTDIKFLRLCVAGQLKQTSKIDFVEITTEPKIHDKLR